MTARVRKTIVLPADLARDVEAAVPAQGKTLSTVIEDALRQARIKRWRQELHGMQNYWSRKARNQGILPKSTLSVVRVAVVFDPVYMYVGTLRFAHRSDDARSISLPAISTVALCPKAPSAVQSQT